MPSVLCINILTQAYNVSNFKNLLDVPKNLLEVVGFKINKYKSVTHSLACDTKAMIFDGTQGYKSLGVIENSKSEDTGETAEKIKTELLVMIERL
ncbi:hypothetical protein NUSPORA_00700 [Nucleospora cyclopteri]